jgi:UDP-N-acetylglucosamine 2-epimerase (non-hydrolysing)
MPEEINRIVTDQLADVLFTPSRDADCNLRREGVDAGRIQFVGNVMIDTLIRLLPKVRERDAVHRLGLKAGDYVLVTIHRPSNVDNSLTLAAIMVALRKITVTSPVVFPVHPRTRQRLRDLSFSDTETVQLTEPQSYLGFVSLALGARMVITDSGGVQEETTFLGIPCLTLRPNTERPVTLTHGTNRLVPDGPESLVSAFHHVLDQPKGPPNIPEYWDGNSSKRIVSALRGWRAS